MSRLLIINADDFGKNALANRAIIDSFRQGLCSSATIMVTTPGFEEACQLSRENRLSSHIGIHLDLSEGFPLSEKIRSAPLFCAKNGSFHFTKEPPRLYLGASAKSALAEEIRAQIKRCRAQGINPTHIDSHNHIHTSWALASVLIPVAREEKITYIRIARNCGPIYGRMRRMYNHFFNTRLRAAAFARTRYFGSLTDYLFLKKQLEVPQFIDSFEIMAHPEFDDLNLTIAEVKECKEAVSFSGSRYLGGA